MLVFPNAKLNLGLYVTKLRPDGYRNLESVFVPLPWCDAFEVLPAPAGAATSLGFSGLPIPGEPETNLCRRAYELLASDFDLPPVHLHLHKDVPIGAGLGGGSADAAFALKAFNSQFALDLPPSTLESYARRLGSDCAFFIRNEPVFAHSRGDMFDDFALDLRGTPALVVYPGLHISTAEAYAHVVPAPPHYDLRESLSQPMPTWRETVSNDFERALTPTYPVLAEVKARLYAAGATYASLSGSGSAVYGLFSGLMEAPELDWPTGYTVWRGQL